MIFSNVTLDNVIIIKNDVIYLCNVKVNLVRADHASAIVCGEDGLPEVLYPGTALFGLLERPNISKNH